MTKQHDEPFDPTVLDQPKRDGGGYAFPQALTEQTGFVGCEGMSLRDYFAGQVAVGIMAHPTLSGEPTSVAVLAYRVADAMLAQRKVEGR